jgi:hypothetical protein
MSPLSRLEHVTSRTHALAVEKVFQIADGGVKETAAEGRYDVTASANGGAGGAAIAAT